MCEAERRNNRALFEIGLQWSSGKLDRAKLEAILAGPPCDCKPKSTEIERSTTAS